MAATRWRYLLLTITHRCEANYLREKSKAIAERKSKTIKERKSKLSQRKKTNYRTMKWSKQLWRREKLTIVYLCTSVFSNFLTLKWWKLIFYGFYNRHEASGAGDYINCKGKRESVLLSRFCLSPCPPSPPVPSAGHTHTISHHFMNALAWVLQKRAILSLSIVPIPICCMLGFFTNKE